MSVTATIAYGPILMGADTGTTDKTTEITNTGNASIGLQLDGFGAYNGDGYAMTCPIGNLTIGYEKYHKDASTAYGSKIALTDTAATVAGFSVAKATSSTHSAGNIYWGLGAPISGVEGACTGAVIFTPV
jgi:thiamine monophosphate kinase